MNSEKSDCYALIQAIVVARDKFCKGPGCSNLATSGHHLYKRDCMATAFNPHYVIGICVNCHGWAHRHPTEFRQWAIYLFGEEDYFAGLKLSKTTCKYQDFNKIRDNLKEILKGFTEPMKGM